jgi:tight adherence protein C
MIDLASLIDAFGTDPVVTFGALLAVAGAMALLFIFGLQRDRKDVRRRASAGIEETGPSGSGGQAKAGSSESLERLMTFLESSFGGDSRQNRLLRLQLVQAGFFAQRAVAVFFAARFGGGLLLGATVFILMPLLMSDMAASSVWLWSAAAGLAGYFLPSLYLRRRIAERVLQHRTGFPDFMDLMVVCAEAGLSMEAAIDRVSRELYEGYPSLAENLYMVSLEIRAGKGFAEALERLGKRLGIEEASMLATLLQQSAELGTSLSQSLRIYSEEMRHKRMSRAEEKAYALPSKLVVPLMLFVFPVLLMTLMLPVAVRLSSAGFGG